MNWNHHRVVLKAARSGARWLSGLLGLALLLTGLGASAACDPSVSCCAGAPSTGSPCGGAGVATLGNTSGVDSGAGNPLNVLGGNKFQREVDMPALPGVLGLELIRYYNSADTERHLLGRGWRLSYETTLRVGTGALAGTLEVVQADGTRIAFALPPDERQGPGQDQGDLYRGLNPLQGLVHRLHTPRGSEYLWRWADGRQLRFNTRGQLEQIRAPSGEFLSLRYDGRGWLSEVIDPAGRRLRLHVLDKASAQDPQRYRGVQGIDTPVGRFVYEHGGQLPEGSSARPSEPIANLSQVIYPAQAPSEGGAASEMRSRRYHHEDLISLTRRRGEVVLSQQRLRYDANGLPIESFRRIGERDVPQTRQAFDAAGRLLWQGVVFYSDKEMPIYASSIVARRNRSIMALGGMRTPESVRVVWRKNGRYDYSHATWYGGTILGDHTIPVAARIPDEVLRDIRAKGGALRLKFRLKPDGVLFGWDIERPGGGISRFDMPGGDFLETRY